MIIAISHFVSSYLARDQTFSFHRIISIFQQWQRARITRHTTSPRRITGTVSRKLRVQRQLPRRARIARWSVTLVSQLAAPSPKSPATGRNMSRNAMRLVRSGAERGACAHLMRIRQLDNCGLDCQGFTIQRAFWHFQMPSAAAPVFSDCVFCLSENTLFISDWCGLGHQTHRQPKLPSKTLATVPDTCKRRLSSSPGETCFARRSVLLREKKLCSSHEEAFFFVKRGSLLRQKRLSSLLEGVFFFTRSCSCCRCCQ